MVGDRGYRLSTIREAGQILVIDGGRITERGRHEDLLAAGGLYAELYRTQFARQQLLTPARRISCDLSPYPTFMGIVPACSRI